MDDTILAAHKVLMQVNGKLKIIHSWNFFDFIRLHTSILNSHWWLVIITTFGRFGLGRHKGPEEVTKKFVWNIVTALLYDNSKLLETPQCINVSSSLSTRVHQTCAIIYENGFWSLFSRKHGIHGGWLGPAWILLGCCERLWRSFHLCPTRNTQVSSIPGYLISLYVF